MRIVIDFVSLPPESEQLLEIVQMLAKVPAKISRIIARDPACLCDAPEDDDTIRDPLGNVRGIIKVYRS